MIVLVLHLPLLLDLIYFSQCVHEPTQCFYQTLDPVLSYGIEIEHLIVFSQNPLLSDHYLITGLYTTRQKYLVL